MGKAICFTLLLGPHLTSASAAEDPRKDAITKGAQYLQGVHKKKDGGDGTYRLGSMCLSGWALLECGVPASDPALVNIVEYVRANAFRQATTYEMSLIIMFLDRLGERVDQPTIQFLAVKLMAGQGALGGWSYSCGFELDEAEMTRVHKAIYGDSQLRTDRPNESLPARKELPSIWANANLHPEALRHARAIEKAIAGNRDLAANSIGDHSNTQFAAMALWIARKHGVPCGNALLLTEKRFRKVQSADGGWTYLLDESGGPADPSLGGTTTPPMTCAGLVALAVGRGSQLSAMRVKSSTKPTTGGDLLDPRFDRAIAAAFKYLERSITNPKQVEPTSEGGKIEDNLYFYWSLERVAMIYDLEKIGNLDWYEWGAKHLIATQAKDGSWGQSGYQGANPEINTAFALLFLNRANLAKDLTATLKGTGTAKINLPERKDPPAKVDPKQTNPVATDFDAEANRLCNELVSATASRRPSILANLRDSKGSVHTEALVRAIAKLSGESQRETREALGQRLRRMTALTLRDMLKDPNREIRSGAATACGLKEDKQYVPDLIAVLNDAEALVVQAARKSLSSLSGKDFGPASTANADEKAKAIADWKTWWATAK